MAEGGQVRRKKAPAFSVKNITAALKGLESKCYDISIWLYVPRETWYHIMRQHSTNSAQLQEIINYVLTLHPYPGWRIIIRALHCMREQVSAARIQEYAEPVTDPSLTVGNVAAVVSVMEEDWYYGLAVRLGVPWSKRDEIRQQHRSLPQQQVALARYCVDFLPGFSWSTLAGALYYCKEKAALQAARRYIKREEDPTLTIENLLSALQPVTDWRGLSVWLDVPWSRRDKMTGKEDMLQLWLLEHPCASWKVVEWALYGRSEVTEHRVLKQLYGKHVTAPQIEMRLNACRQAIRNNETIDQIIMQGVFFGLPRSGKTLSKKRLLGKKPAMQQASTGVAEKVSKVEIAEKTTVFTWNEITELSEETALVVEDITEHVTTGAQHDYIEDKQAGRVNNGSATPVKRNNLQQNDRKQAVHSDSFIPAIVRKVIAMFSSTTKETESDAAPDRQLQVLSMALKSTSTRPGQYVDKKWTIYLSDAGGQPEFQEMLPALVSGPSLYFLTFPLNKSLNEPFIVEYQHPDGSSIVPFEITSTMKEVLLQSLASIASTRSYTRVDDRKAVAPKILFIATHKDKLESYEQLLKIDQQLQDIIKKTVAFRENMIVFCSKQQMVFALNNKSEDDSDIQHVRNAVEQICTTSDEYKIQTPCTWMIFAITLRHLPERVLSMDQCIEIGKKCGIDTQEELDNALWYLHNNVGVLRHFQDHPELRNIVINEPQYIFDKVTELIVDTFTFDKVGPYLQQEFSNKGIFSADRITMLSTDSDTLTSDKLAILLEHLRILVPIEKNEDGKVIRYFVPAALTHADPPPDTQSQALIPPLLLIFECGFCPKGLFGSLIVQLLKDKAEWHLKQEKIFRDQIEFRIGPYDTFCLTHSPTSIQIDCVATLNPPDRRPLGAVCCDVRDHIVNSVEIVTQKLHYNEHSHMLAFACPEHKHAADNHPATIYFQGVKACSLTCTETETQLMLSDTHMIWFNEDMSFQLIEGLPLLSCKPVLRQLDLIEFKDKTLKVIDQSAAKWERLATRLYFGSHDVSRIRNDYHLRSIDACRTVIIEWLNGRGRKPTTWCTLIKALIEADLSELAGDLELALPHLA